MPWTPPTDNQNPHEGNPSNNDKKDNRPNKTSPEGPPDLDEVFRQLGQKIRGLLNGKKKPVPEQRRSPSGEGPGNQTFDFKFNRMWFGLGVGIVFLVWILSGIYIVSPAEESVVLTFGKYSRTEGPGPHWILQLVQSQKTLNVQKISTYSYNAQMLTKDQNIVDVAVAVQYRISNAKNYLYSVAYPIESLQQAAASALRQVIGQTNLDDVLTTGRAVVRQQVVDQLNTILPIYNAGIIVTDVALQPAKAPEQVKEAFDDAIKAQEDEQRYINQAQAYAMGVVPTAQGQAQRILQEAQAYKQQVVLQAQADVARYLAVLPVYLQSPQVTRERLYLTTLESVLANSNKVLLDTRGSQNLYLPLDNFFKSSNSLSSVQNGGTDMNASTNGRVDATSGNSVQTQPASSNSEPANGARPTRFTFVNPDSQVN